MNAEEPAASGASGNCSLEPLTAGLPDCLLRDRHRLGKRIDALRRQEVDDNSLAKQFESLVRDIQASRRRVEDRRAARPAIAYDDALPIAAKREAILDAIRDHQVVVICGETGSGKTTQIPKICLELGRGVFGSIGHTQPRRIAARSVARRIAEELGCRVGSYVGWKVRFDDETSKDTCVKLLTDGMLLAETQRDPLLEQYDTIIIDEAHERSLNIDFLLGYMKGLLPLRPELKVVITSATIDPDRFSEHFGDAPIIEVSGRTFPVDVRYRPAPVDDDEELALERQVVLACEELMSEGRGDILVFLSGEREINECREALEDKSFPKTRVLPLYARLSSKDQQRVFQPHDERHIVLATNVAETSLTVPGIRYVIDSGRAKVSRYSARAKIQRLPVERVSQASAKQRAGRCGRLEDGICIRLFDEEDFERRREFTQPEIQRTNLASVILQMKSLDLGDIEAFPFIDPPSNQLIRDGYQTLFDLGAVGEDLRLTAIGHQLARLPIDPRVGRILLEASRLGCLSEMLTIAAALSVQDPNVRPSDRKQDADRVHARHQHQASDFLSYLVLYRAYETKRNDGTRSALRRWCRKNYLSYPRMREWEDLRHQVAELVERMDWPLNEGKAPDDDIHRAVIPGFVRHVAIRGKGHAYLGTKNVQVFVFPGSTLFAVKPKWIISAERVETTRLYARIVAPIRRAWIEPYAAHLAKRTYSDAHFDEKQGHVLAFERITLDGLVLVKRRRVHFGRINPKRSREIFIRHALVLGRYKTNAPFARHNASVIGDAKELAIRVRDRTLELDGDDLFAFFDSVVPADVVGRKSFERWRRHVEADNPTALFLPRDEMLRTATGRMTPEEIRTAFPDAIVQGGTRLELAYRYQPGHRADGVTLRVPIERLSQISGATLSWLVPGLRIAKITALLKTLPKSIRKQLVPLPDRANVLNAKMKPGGTHLIPALTNALADYARIRVSTSEFRPEKLEPHLEMNIRVIGNDGMLLAEGRSLDAVRKRLRQHAKHAVDVARKQLDDGTIHTSWTFGDIPFQEDTDRKGYSVPTYPTLIDVDTGVRLTLVDEPRRAARLHVDGLVRLGTFTHRKELRSLIRGHAQIQRLELLHATLGSSDALHDGLMGLLIRTASTLTSDIRSEADFKVAMTSARSRLGPTFHRNVIPIISDSLNAYADVARKLMLEAPPGFEEPISDMMGQLARLVEPGWIYRTPLETLRGYPRYLQAMNTRLIKLGQGELKRDRRLSEQIRPHWQRYLDREARHFREHTFDPELERMRWMLEDFRVTLFASGRGQPNVVSVEQLRAQWDRCVQ